MPYYISRMKWRGHKKKSIITVQGLPWKDPCVTVHQKCPTGGPRRGTGKGGDTERELMQAVPNQKNRLI